MVRAGNINNNNPPTTPTTGTATTAGAVTPVAADPAPVGGLSVEILQLLINTIRNPTPVPAAAVAIPPPLPQVKLSPFTQWKNLESQVQDASLESNFEWNLNTADPEKDLADKADIKLSHLLFVWMMEIFPILLSRPFDYAQQIRKRDQAQSCLRGRINSEKIHNLAAEIEERIEIDDEHVTIGKAELKNHIASEVAKNIESINNKKKRKNSSGEEGTTSPSNIKNGAAKKAKKVRIQEQKDANSDRKKGKGNNSNNRHDFRPGGRKSHQRNRPKGKERKKDKIKTIV